MNDKPPPLHEPLPPIAARLQELMRTLQRDMPHFAQQLGCPEQLLRDYLAHPTGANLEFLATVLSKVDGIRAEWLLAGRGPMMRPASQHQASNQGNTIGINQGLVLHVSHAECQAQLKLAMQLIEHQQQSLCDKDRIIHLLENQLPHS